MLETLDTKSEPTANLSLDSENFYLAAIDLPSDLAPTPGVPTLVRVLPLGTWKGYIDPQTKQRKTITITEREKEQALETFRRMKAKHPSRDLVVDNDHLTFKDKFAPAFGWIKDLVDLSERGIGALIEWTQLGLDAISKKLYKYISPVFFWNGVDKETGEKIPFGILNASLVNEPFFDELVIQAKHIIPLTKEITTMDKLIARLREVYHLTPTATEDEILAQFDEQQTTAAQLVAAKTEIFAALDLKPEATIEEAKAKILATRGTPDAIQQLQTEISALKTQLLDREFERIVGKALGEGRILPAQMNNASWLKVQKDWAAKDLTGFEAYWAKAPVIGPLTEILTSKREEGGELKPETVQAYAEQHKLSFKQAAIALTTRKN